MKKRLIVTGLLAGIVLSGVAYLKANADGYSREEIKDAKNYLRSKIVYTQKLYDCTPFQTELFGEYTRIIGREKSRCHVQIQNVDCYYPTDVAKQYSRASESFLRKMIDELDTKGTMNKTLMNEDLQQMKRINYKYCSMPED